MNTFTLIYKIYFGTLRKDLGRNGSLFVSCVFPLLVATFVLSLAVELERITVPPLEQLIHAKGTLAEVAPSVDGGRLVMELRTSPTEVVSLHLSEIGGSAKAIELARQLQGMTVTAGWFVSSRFNKNWNELIQLSIEANPVIEYEAQKAKVERWKAQHVVAIFLFFTSLLLYLVVQPIRYFHSQARS